MSEKTITMDEALKSFSNEELKTHLSKTSANAEIERDEKEDKVRKTYFKNFQKAMAGDDHAAKIIKTLDTTSGFQVRESLSTAVETVVNEKTPLLSKLLRRGTASVNAVNHTWNMDYDSPDQDDLQTGYEFSVSGLNTDGIDRRSATYPVAPYASLAKVGTVMNSQKIAELDGTEPLDKEVASVTRKMLRQINNALFDGDQTVNAKGVHGLNAFQRDKGDALLRINAGGSPVSKEMINELIAKVGEVGGGGVSDIFMSSQDNLVLQNEISKGNEKAGKDQFFATKFPSVEGDSPFLNVDNKPASLQKKVASATHASGAVEFTGTITNADTVTIAGIVYTAAATADAVAKTFLSGTAAVSIASLISIVAQYSKHSGLATAQGVTGVTGANFTLTKGGLSGNYETIEATGANITVNTAVFSGGTNSSVYLAGLEYMQLAEFVLAGAKGFQSVDLSNSTEPMFIQKMVIWLGLLEVNNPNSIAIIENAG